MLQAVEFEGTDTGHRTEVRGVRDQESVFAGHTREDYLIETTVVQLEVLPIAN